MGRLRMVLSITYVICVYAVSVLITTSSGHSVQMSGVDQGRGGVSVLGGRGLVLHRRPDVHRPGDGAERVCVCMCHLNAVDSSSIHYCMACFNFP